MAERLSLLLIVALVSLGCGSPGAGPEQEAGPAADQPPEGSAEEILSGDFESGTTEEWAQATDATSESGSDPASDRSDEPD